MCFALQRPAIFPEPNFKKWSETVSFLTFWLANVLRATVACHFSTSQLQKVVRASCVLYILLTWRCGSRYSGVQFFYIATSKNGPRPSVFSILTCKYASRYSGVPFFQSQLQKMARDRQFFNILTCKCASRNSGVPFFHIPTSKSGPHIVCFVHFDLKIRFSLQRRAIFPHPNFKKWFEHRVFCTFWLENALLATAACHFSTSQLQKVVRAWCVLYILTWKCASRYSGVHVFISPLDCYLRTSRFTEPTFRPNRRRNHWENTAVRDFPNISRLWIFFLLTFAQLYLFSSDSTSLLCFFNCPYCRKLDFKTSFDKYISI